MLKKLTSIICLFLFFACSKDSNPTTSTPEETVAEEPVNEESPVDNADSQNLLENEIYVIIETSFVLPSDTDETSIGKLEISSGLQTVVIDKSSNDGTSGKRVEIVYPTKISVAPFGISTVDVTNDGVPIGYAVNIPGSSLKVNAESTAIAIVFMHPFLQEYDIDVATAVINRIKQSPSFPDLVVEVARMMKNGSLDLGDENFNPKELSSFTLVATDVLNSFYTDISINENGIEIIEVEQDSETVSFKVRNRRKRWLKMIPTLIDEGATQQASFYSPTLNLEYPFGYVKSFDFSLIKQLIALNPDLTSLKHDSDQFIVNKKDAEKLILNLYGMGLSQGTISEEFLANHFDIFALGIFSDYLMPIAETATGIGGIKERMDNDMKIVGRPNGDPISTFVDRYTKHYLSKGNLHLKISDLWGEGKYYKGIEVLFVDILEYLISDEDGNTKLLYDILKNMAGEQLVIANHEAFKSVLRKRLAALSWIRAIDGVTNLSSAVRAALISDERTEKIINLNTNQTATDPVFLLDPTNNQQNIPLDYRLDFRIPTDYSSNYTFKVFLDTNESANQLISEGSNNDSYEISDLAANTTYFWRVETINSESELIATSDIWNFTTMSQSNVTVGSASNLSPSDNAIDQPLNGSFSLTPGVNTPSDAVYRIYTGRTLPIENYIDTPESTNIYDGLFANTQYFWRVETFSSSGELLASSDTWSFTTGNGITGSVYDGSVWLTTQQEVDSFGANNYSEITGTLKIGSNDSNVDITSLSSLSSLKVVHYYLSVFNCNLLTNLNGLDQLVMVNDIYISNNELLDSIDAFKNISSLDGDLQISQNNNLSSIHGLSNITAVSGRVYFDGNYKITSFSSLSNLISIGEDLSIVNSAVTDLKGFENVRTVGYLAIINNGGLKSLNELKGISSISKGLFINNNANLTSIDALNNILTVVSEEINIYSNNLLESIGALSSLTEVGGNLVIARNDALLTISGLENLTTVGKNLVIEYNDLISSLNGLENVSTIGDNLDIRNNDSLTNFCAITQIVKSYQIQGEYRISNNAYNPSIQNIIDGNCSN